MFVTDNIFLVLILGTCSLLSIYCGFIVIDYVRIHQAQKRPINMLLLVDQVLRK